MFTSTVRKIIKDKNGFLWFSTQDGLHKYDGNSTEKFTKDNIDNNKNLLGTDCFDMEYELNEDYLYILSSYEGINIININTNAVQKQVLSKEFGYSDNATFFNQMVRVGSRLIITSTDSRFVIYNTVTKKIEKSGQIKIPSGALIRNLFVFKGMVGALLSDSTIRYFNVNDLKQINQVNCSAKVAELKTIMSSVVENKIWLSTNNGIYCVNLENGIETDLLSQMPNFPAECLGVNTFMVQQVNKLLFIANNVGVFVYNLNEHRFNKIYSNKGEADNNLLSSVRSVLFTDGQLWLGGPYGIAQVKQLNPVFSPYYRSPRDATVKIGQAYGLSIEKDLVFVAAEDGAYKVEMKTNAIERLSGGQLFFSTGNIGGGRFLLSGIHNLLLYQNGVVQNAGAVYKELKPIVSDPFISIKQVSTNKIILASQKQKAIYLWNMKMHTLQAFNNQTSLQIEDLIFSNIFVEAENRVFIVSQTTIQLIDFTRNKTQVVFRMDQLGNKKSGAFMDMCRQGDYYWIAGYGLGIIKLNNEFRLQSYLGTKDKIENLGLYKIFNAGDSLVVATSNSGLVCYNTRQKKLHTYYGADGLQSGSFNQYSGCQQGDSIYVGGLNGISLFNTKNYRTNNEPPKLYFNTITYEAPTGIKDTTNLFIKKVQIPNNATQTKISFTGLNYFNPRRVTYSYKINGLQDNWTAFKTENFVQLIGTPPGTYTLQVKAANEDGVVCAPISMQLYFLPKWYQTWLFKIVVVLLVAGLLYVLYSFRIKQLKRIITVRQKISSDLHDDIGSTLSTINMYSQVAQLHGSGNAPIMLNIQENAQEVLEKLDDIVWATNPKNDQVKNLAERIDVFARPLLQAKGIQFVFRADDNIGHQKISEIARQNLFLICKEAINNAAKYAQCKTCTLSLFKKKGCLHCIITDDGIGFNTSTPTQRNGLLNIQLRAAAVKGKVDITSSAGNGTSIAVQVPF